MRWMTWALMTLALFAAAIAEAAEDPSQKKVLIIGLDGCRADALKAADAPNLHKLIDEGTWAEDTHILAPHETGADTCSAPGWSNLLTGVWADKHGVIDNSFKGANYAEFPPFFIRLKQARPDVYTASLAAWQGIHDQIIPEGAADVSRQLGGNKRDDAGVAAEAVKLLMLRKLDVLFLHFDGIDHAGHKHGFHPTVPEYMDTIHTVDGYIGDVLNAIGARPKYSSEDWLVIVCTDHGGRGTKHSHSHDAPEVRNVFLIVSGPSAQRGTLRDTTYQVDVAPTVFAHLGIAVDPSWKWDGRSVGLKPPSAAN